MKVSVSESILLLRELTSQGLNPFLVLYPTLYEEFLLEVSEKEFELSNQLLSYLSTFEHWQMKTFKFHDLEKKRKKISAARMFSTCLE